jgi:two-component system NtrC family sensor kinase
MDQRMPLRSLTQLGQELAGTVTLDTAVDLVARVLNGVLEPDRMLIVLPDSESQVPFVAYSSNYAKPRPDDPLIELVIRRGPRVLAPPSPEQLRTLWGPSAEPVGAWMGAPILVGGNPVGAVSITANRPRSFEPWHHDFLLAATTQLGIALENSRLLRLLSLGKLEWEQTVDALSQAFCLVDRDERIRRANRAFAALMSEPLTRLAGRPWRDVLPGEWSATVEDVLEDPVPGRPHEVRLRGGVFTVAAYRLAAPGGTTLLVFEDQTERRRLQEQLIQSEKMSAVGQLIAGVAHDLNNPLASVVGFADFLIEAGQAPPHLRDPLETIRNEAERAAKIVRSLLTFARKHEGERRPQPIGPILDATLLLLQNELTVSRVSAHLTAAPDLPPVAVDANQLQQVFVNVIHNAVQAIAASGIGDTIEIRAGRAGDRVSVTVSDNGPGVPPEIAGRVFEPFFTTKAEGEGTGLGLSICQGIIREHGGSIVHESPEGGGAVFQIELPACAAPVPPEPRRVEPTRTLRILVVDDEPTILHYMQATLEAWGHLVQVAEDGTTALDAVGAQPFDLIITDLRMPALGGREFYDVLCDQYPAVARSVVFATGDTVRGDTLAFLEAHGRPYLRKPFTLAELRAILTASAD